MFSFEVVNFDGDSYQPTLTVCSPVFTATFAPEARLPRRDQIDVKAKQSSITFDHHDGLVALEWNEKTVCIELSSFGSDKGALTIAIVKTDDSLATALQQWLDFEKKLDLNNT